MVMELPQKTNGKVMLYKLDSKIRLLIADISAHPMIYLHLITLFCDYGNGKLYLRTSIIRYHGDSTTVVLFITVLL